MLQKLTLGILLLGLLITQPLKSEVVIDGKISGKIPDKVEYTVPIHGICNDYFLQSVKPDAAGNFRIRIDVKEPGFIKLRTSYQEQGILIVEPGKTYRVQFNLEDKTKLFTVTDKSAVVQEAYGKLPNPGHIQLGAREFQRDTVAATVKKTIDRRRADEIAVFEKFYQDKIISQKVFDLIKADRNCYYDAILATVAWIKDYMVIRGRMQTFAPDFAGLWKDVFNQPLFSTPEVLQSPWFRYYAECYVNFQTYIHGDFTREKMEETNKLKQGIINKVNESKKYLPINTQEDYIASYLYEVCDENQYQKELIGLFDDFKSAYPNSPYISVVAPLVDKIVKYHQAANTAFNAQMKFVEDYQNKNSLAEIAKAIGKPKIFVDVWATWCGPCKAEFAHNAELQKLLKPNDIPVLYISIDRDQEAAQWENMIKFYHLEGYHVRANAQLNAELTKLYDKNGLISIPWYMLLDNNGTILIRHANAPSQLDQLANAIREK